MIACDLLLVCCVLCGAEKLSICQLNVKSRLSTFHITHANEPKHCVWELLLVNFWHVIAS